MSTITLDHAQLEQLADMIANRSAPSLLDAEQAGTLLSVPSSWVLAQARAKRIPHTRLGHYVRFNRDELLAWVDRRQAGPTTSKES